MPVRIIRIRIGFYFDMATNRCVTHLKKLKLSSFFTKHPISKTFPLKILGFYPFNPSSWFFANITEKSGLFAMLLLVISTSYLSWM
jgi:hypothetical protein